jgi:hypothetical protein
MTITWKTLSQNVLTGTPAAVYTATTPIQAAIHAAQVWNPTGSPVTVQVFIVPASGSATDATRVDNVVVAAGTALPVFGLINQKLSLGQSIYAAGNGVTLTVGGAESV